MVYVNTLEIDFDLVSKITSCTQCFYTQEAGDSDNAESFVTFSKNTHIWKWPVESAYNTANTVSVNNF